MSVCLFILATRAAAHPTKPHDKPPRAQLILDDIVLSFNEAVQVVTPMQGSTPEQYHRGNDGTQTISSSSDAMTFTLPMSDMPNMHTIHPPEHGRQSGCTFYRDYCANKCGQKRIEPFRTCSRACRHRHGNTRTHTTTCLQTAERLADEQESQLGKWVLLPAFTSSEPPVHIFVPSNLIGPQMTCWDVGTIPSPTSSSPSTLPPIAVTPRTTRCSNGCMKIRDWPFATCCYGCKTSNGRVCNDWCEHRYATKWDVPENYTKPHEDDGSNPEGNTQ